MNADHYFLPDTALTCGEHPADDDAVRSMLAEVAASLRPPVSNPPTNADIVRVVCGAARRLGSEKGAFNEALRATLCVPANLRNHVAIFSNRCSALFRLNAWDDLHAELDRLYKLPHVRPERDARLQLLATRFGSAWRMKDWTRFRPFLSQPIEISPAEWMCAPFENELGGSISPAIFSRLARLGPFEQGSDRLKDLQLSATQADRDLYLWRADGQARTILDAPEKYDADTLDRARSMVDQFDTIVNTLVKADISPICRALEAGRNAIVLRVHAGVRLIEPALQAAGVPIWNVVKHDVRKTGTRTVLVAPGPGLNLGFVKLAKELKRRPQIVVIFPDGVAGSEPILVDLGPVRAKIRLGGAALARMAKSTLFFTRSIWTGDGYQMELIKGPEIEPEMTADEVNDQFVAFYAEGLRRVISGAIVDYRSGLFSICFEDENGANGPDGAEGLA